MRFSCSKILRSSSSRQVLLVFRALYMSCASWMSARAASSWNSRILVTRVSILKRSNSASSSKTSSLSAKCGPM